GQPGERPRVADREVGEQFPVHLDVRALEAGDERAVREAVDARGRVDAGDPQPPEVPLARAPVLEGVLTAALHGLEGALVELAATAVVALGGLEDLAPPGTPGDDRLGAWHDLRSPRPGLADARRRGVRGGPVWVSAGRASAACGPGRRGRPPTSRAGGACGSGACRSSRDACRPRIAPPCPSRTA